MMVKQEVSMIVSSSPNNGAVNMSADGSYFEIQLQDALAIPAEALNATLSVEEASVWFTTPNIISGKNDKIYITGPSASPLITNRTTLGYPIASTYSMTGISADQSTLSISNLAAGMPLGDFILGDKFRPDSGISNGIEYTIISIITDTVNTKEYIVSGFLENNIPSNTGMFSRLRYNIANNYILTIPQGLYDLNGINQAISRELENAGANSLISLTPDEPTNRVEIRFNYNTVVVNFTYPDTPREILGFNNAIYGPYATVPLNVIAPNIAQFNQVNYYLIHSDLTNKGIRFNNAYNQTIAQVLIDVAPGSQIISKPFNPARINVNELIGAKRNNIRMWLTDDSDNRVNTNNEYWSARLVIRYFKPYLVGSEEVRR